MVSGKCYFADLLFLNQVLKYYLVNGKYTGMEVFLALSEVLF